MARRQKAKRVSEAQRRLVFEGLRDVAKRGLEDPSLLTDLHALLDLDEVKQRAKSSDVLGRARAFVELFSELLSDFSRDSSPRRIEMVNYLFRPGGTALERSNITRRREYLAKNADTSRFRQREEDPLLNLLATILLERRSREHRRADTTAEQHQKLTDLALVFRTCRRTIEKHITGDFPRLFDMTAISFGCFCELHTQFYDTYNSDSLTVLLTLFPTEPDFARFRAELLSEQDRRQRIHNLYPFSFRELALLRQHRRTTETALFFDYFKTSSEGKALYESWTNWLNSCRCENEPASFCAVHGFLAVCAQFDDLFVSAVERRVIDTPPPLNEYEVFRKLDNGLLSLA